MKFLGKFGVVIPSSILLLVGIIIYTLIELLFIETFLLLIFLTFILLWCFPTYLILDNDFIEVRIGFNKKKMLCKDIISLEKTHNPTQDYGLSLDRIKIKSHSDSMMVSLRKNDEFIEHLINKKPHIKYIKN